MGGPTAAEAGPAGGHVALPPARRWGRGVGLGDAVAVYGHVDAGAAMAARFHQVPWLPARVGAMTLGRRVLVRVDRWDDAQLVAHELVHVEQVRAVGLARFLVAYVAAYGRGLATHRSHRLAYRAIPAEREARERAGRWRPPA